MPLRCRQNCLQVVLLETSISQQSAGRTATKKEWRGEGKGWQQTHVGVLCIDSSNQIGEVMFLFVLVGYEEGVDLEVAMVDSEAGFVRDPDAVSEGGSARMVVSGHVMEHAGEEAGRKWD